MRATTLGTAMLVAFTACCAPSFSGLVANRNYREAICAAADGGEDRQELLRDALEEDAAVYAHVHVVSDSELTPVLGDSSSAVSQRARFARVRLRTNNLPIEDLEIDAAILDASGGSGAAPVSWETLAWATQEVLPPSQTRRTYITAGNMLRLIAATATVGLSLLFSPFRAEEVEVAAPPSEFRRVAPLASALHEAMGSGGCRALTVPTTGGATPRAGRTCEGFYMLDSSPTADWRLEVRQRFISHRIGSDLPEEDRNCAVETVSVVPLGQGSAIESRARETFGEQMRLLSEISAR